jgi:(2Fe-2S) ferredoxin
VLETSPERPAASIPGLTACSLCVGETLGTSDTMRGGQLSRLRRLDADGVARLTLSECLDECERGDVVVARPSAAGRQALGKPVWFERLAGDERSARLRCWLERGGPGIEDVPADLKSLVIDRVGPDDA